MAAASCLLTEDQFLCSICLDVFTDPVTIPCGHNFCKTCITEHWDIKVPSQCPNCNKAFNTRPELHVNTLFSEMAARYRQSAQQKPKEVPREVYSGTKLKALVFFLVCLMFVLVLWMVLDHKKYVVVLLKEEYEGKKAELEKTKAKTQQMIQKRQLKIEEIKRSVELSKEGADREIADGVQVFTALKESVERSLNKLINTIKEKQRKTEEQAEGFIKELEQEISELQKRSAVLEQLSHSEDHLYLIQSYTLQNTAPPTKNWTDVNVRPTTFKGTVRRALNQLEETLHEVITDLFKAELKRVQQYAVDVTLDPDTAHGWLIISDDGKQVKHGDVLKSPPKNPKRFDTCFNVLAKQSFSSGRFYFEVQFEGKTDWDLGVARESINRKGEIMLSPQKGYWTISLLNEIQYYAHDVRLSLKSQPEKVGVFVDYEEGLVSFYDINSAALIYSFTGCSFSDKLYPFFSPCNFVFKSFPFMNKNYAPMIISPVSPTELNNPLTDSLTFNVINVYILGM